MFPRRAPRLATHLATVVVTLLAGSACDRDAPTSAATSSTGATPLAPRDGAVSVVGSRADVPLGGPRVDARPGDFLLRSGGLIAVVDAARGRVVDLGFEGKDDGLVYVEPGLLDGFDLARSELERISPGPGAAEVTVVKRVGLRGIRFEQRVRVVGQRLEIETIAENEGEVPLRSSSLGETVHFGNSPTFVEGHGLVFKGGSYGGRFTTIATPFERYAVCKAEGSLYARFSAPDYAGAFTPYRSGETFGELAVGARTAPRRLSLVVARGGRLDEAASVCAPATRRIALPPETPKDASVEVARCRAGSTDEPGERYLLVPPAPERADIALPEGCFVLRLVRRASAPGAWFPADDRSGARRADLAPRAGRLAFSVVDGGGPIPAKLTLLPTKKGAPLPDLGLDPEAGVAQNAIYSLDGTGEVDAPPGEYDVLVGRGPEYTQATVRVRVEPAATAKVEAKIERVVDTASYTSADLHVHAIPSFDSPVSLADRLRSLVAVDVQAFAATDHNRVTDYAPVIAELGLSDRIASIVGDEVTTFGTDFGHFNAFPLPIGSPPLPFTDVTPADIVRSTRAVGALLQVNHPRMGRIGYFELLRFDPRRAEESLARAPLFDRGFDAIEVFNGDDYSDAEAVEKVLQDWYALLRAGVRVTATGNSDSHRASFQEAGVPRNWVRMPDRGPGQPFDEPAFVDALRRGRVIVSSGPFVDLRVAGAEVGDDVAAGEVEIAVTVKAPPWIDVTRIDLVQTGEMVHTWRKAPAAGAESPPPEPEPLVPDAQGFGDGVERFVGKLTRTAKTGDFFLVVVRGEEPMRTLSRKDARPFAFTNPVFVR